MGARLVLVARDERRAEATLKRLRKASAAQAPLHTAHLADLSPVPEARRVAREIAAACVDAVTRAAADDPEADGGVDGVLTAALQATPWVPDSSVQRRHS